MSTPDVSAPGPAVTVPAPVVSVRPVVIAVPGRGDDLQVRVSAPVTGDSLPVVVFSHGFGWSMDAYAPLADYWDWLPTTRASPLPGASASMTSSAS